MKNKYLTSVLIAVMAIGLTLSLGMNYFQTEKINSQDSIITQQQDTLIQARDALLQAKDLIDQCSTSDQKAELNSKYNVFMTLTSKDGIIKSQSHNLVTNLGLNYSASCIGNGTCGAAFNYIAVGGNTSAQGVTDTTLANEFSTCGLTRATGTYTATGIGTWSLTKVFSISATCNHVNSTGIFNASSTGTMLAEASFTDTNVANGDSLNITWTGSQSGT
jgi:hypothetical protein